EAGPGVGDPDPKAQGLTPEAQRPFVVFLDEIDAVRSLPFSTDEFFAAIRECYNRRTRDPAFERLTFCLLGVAAPTDLIRDTRMTPFNIGKRIELTDFTEEEADILRVGMEVGDLRTPGRPEKEARALLKRILYWTGGHPYLTQQLCREVSNLTPVAIATPPLHLWRGGYPRFARVWGVRFVDRLCAGLF